MTEDFPFIYGRNVTLFCNTSAVGLKKTTWMKQSDVILHQGLSFYPDKYTGNEVTDGSSLIIMNATELDFNTSYTCLSDVYSYEADLMINSSNFICLPQNRDISWNIIDKNIFVQLHLERFFPMPKCKTMFDDAILSTNQEELSHLQGPFFNGTINITSRSDADLCGGNLTVVCMFGGSYYEDIETKYLQDCNDTVSFLQESDSSVYVFGFEGAVIGVCIPCVSLCFGCVLFHCKKREKAAKKGMY
ncbi:unnamed protein product [Mytilus coruscus]|uniref:Ig-like domain-containing protein n=1 Tax=Mytilus coruscus TaxID=42192 RepID=A0A6J8BCD7_MYTCO|nr:unnamed protein product [Mytilus coruscus]